MKDFVSFCDLAQGIITNWIFDLDLKLRYHQFSRHGIQKP